MSQASRAMTTVDEALASVGVTAQTLRPADRQSLDERGYVVLANMIERSWLEKLRAAFEEIAARKLQSPAGRESGTRHLPALFDEGELFERVYTHPMILAAAHYVLKRGFGAAQFGGRDPLPGYGQQGLHTDWMQRGPQAPAYVVTSIWMLDDFTTENGATRVVPGTHRLSNTVPKNRADPASRHPEEVRATGAAGGVLVFNGHLWHSGMRNHSKGSRRALQLIYHAREVLRYSGMDQSPPQGESLLIRYLKGR